MSGTDTAAMVPNVYDIVIDGYGYVTARAVDPNLPFRVQQQAFSYTPTFLERTNVGDAYGDDQQAFFLTEKQNDWSLGAGQTNFRQNDNDSVSRYYSSSGLHVAEAGEVSVLPSIASVGNTTSVIACCPSPTINTHAYVTTVSLSTVTTTGVLTNVAAHGAGTPNQWGMCSDGVNTYIAGSTSIRQWTGAAFSTFSATANAGALAFLNNALYSCDGSTLNTYDSAGTKTTLFTWKDATGTARTALAQHPRIVAYGGKLLIFFPLLDTRPSLWIYDGSGTSMLAQLPEGAIGYDIQVIDGIAFLSGTIAISGIGGQTGVVAVVWYFANGAIGELWRAADVDSSAPSLNGKSVPLGAYGGNLIFARNGVLSQYNVASAAISDIGTVSNAGGGVTSHISSTAQSVFFGVNASNKSGSVYPSQSDVGGTATLTTSYFDFGNTRPKLLRGATVDWTNNSGSVDIAYLIDGVTSGTLQTGAVSGTEYLFPAGTTGHRVQFTLTLTRPSLFRGPLVKRLYLRAAPIMQAYRVNTFILDLGGVAGKGMVRRRDGSDHTLTGEEMRVNLQASITSQTPLTITDRTGTYTGVLEPAACEFDETNPGEWYAQIKIREV